MSNSLDPDQDRHFVGPDLDPKLFAKVIGRKQKSWLARKDFVRLFNNNLILLVPVNTFFTYVGRGLPGLNQY